MNTQTLAVRCGDIGDRRGVSGDCAELVELRACVTELLILEKWVFFPDLFTGWFLNLLI